jgi:hypothetical protein
MARSTPHMPVVAHLLNQTTHGEKIIPLEQKDRYEDAAIKAMGLTKDTAGPIEFTKIIESEWVESADGLVNVFKRDHEVVFR